MPPASLCVHCGKAPLNPDRMRRGLCPRCYRHVLKTERGITTTPRTVGSAEDRLLDKVVAGWGGCWIFIGGRTINGYGTVLGPKGKTCRAARLAYELFVGPIPEGLHLDHLCRVRACVNPRHLEPVTQRTNTLRGESFSAVNAAKTHCVNGHPFTDANTYHQTPTQRRCRACNNIRVAAYQLRKKLRREADTVTFLDAFLTDPDDPAERASAEQAVAEIRSYGPPCDCDRADPRDQHESWCPAVREIFCTNCLNGHDPDDCPNNPETETT